MRIGIDASPLLLRSAGVKNYLFHWTEHLRRAGSGHTFQLFPFIGKTGPLDHDRSMLGPLATLPRLALLYFVNAPGNPAIDWIARRSDVFHATNQVRVPPRSVPLTATVHDMTCWMMPELHTAANVRADHNYAEKILSQAAGLIAVSESTKTDASRVLNMDPERIEVIYPGVTDAFFQPMIEGVRQVKQQYRLERPYVLFLGTIEPRKNVDTLLEAWEQVPADLLEEHLLVVAGPEGWSAERTVARLRSAGTGVRYLGYVAENDLASLVAGATVFAYPSLYEGFGFPVAQALAAGVPVVTSNVSSLPEVCGESAALVDPRSSAEISSALERLLTSPSQREHMAARGKERALAFRWDNCARHSLLFFERVLGR